jgi:hypothetical protein
MGVRGEIAAQYYCDEFGMVRRQCGAAYAVIQKKLTCFPLIGQVGQEPQVNRLQWLKRACSVPRAKLTFKFGQRTSAIGPIEKSSRLKSMSAI